MGGDDNSEMSDAQLANATRSPFKVAPEPLRGAVRLSDWGLIRASGEDARSFLQGQLTQDVIGLAPDAARLAGYCSAKGRLLASFVVLADGPQDLLLACSADLLATALKRLSMFVLRARCRLEDASADHALWGVAGAADLPRPWRRHDEAGLTTIGLPPALIGGAVLPRALCLTAADATPASLPAMPEGQWRWLEVMSGVPRIVAATAERFVPQMVNLDLVGGVSFQKGCYPGQEVVARSQYRGTLKRRGCLLGAASAAAPGDEIFHSTDPGQPAGQVVLAGSHGCSHAVFAELKIAALAEGSLHLASAGGPALQPLPLPYAVPAEQV
jgi:folate-binding protein YgfZ